MAEELKNLLVKYNNNKGLDKVIERIDSDKRLEKMDIDIIESSLKSSGILDVDSVLTNVMLLINKYNYKYLNFPKVNDFKETKKEKESKKNIEWSDILSYLEIDYNDLEDYIIREMETVTNFNGIIETAKFIKNSRNPENRIINKIGDSNIVICILLYSSKKHIADIIEYFRKDGKVDTRCLGKAIEAIPSIFIDKSSENIPACYSLFKKNYDILSGYGIDIRDIIINKPILMISTKLQELLDELGSDEEYKRAVVSNAGNVLISHEGLYSKNKELLSQFGINMDKCKSGKGFQVFGSTEMEDKLAKIKEMSYDDEVLSKNDTGESLESIRGFVISKIYSESKDKGISYRRGAA